MYNLQITNYKLYVEELTSCKYNKLKWYSKTEWRGNDERKKGDAHLWHSVFIFWKLFIYLLT